MCVCSISAEQLELDLAHTLPSPTTHTTNDLYLPTKENFEAAVEMALRDGDWFWEQAQEQIEQHISDSLEQCVEEEVRSFFNNWDLSDHINISDEISNAFDNYDFVDAIDDRVDDWLNNNFDAEDHVSDAVNNYFDNTVDVYEVAKQNITEILKDVDFIEALAAEMLRQQQQAKPAQTQGETNESV